MSKRVFVFVFILTLLVSNAASPSNALKSKDKDSRSSPKVVMVSIPRINWETLRSADTPNIDKLIESGSVASFSVKSSDNKRTIESAYASISAGNRASAVHPSVATFYNEFELVGSRNAGDIFQRERGISPKQNQIVGIGFEQTLSKNDSGLNPAAVGSFGQVLENNGKSVAVFGNADFCYREIPSCSQRAVGYLGTNKEGLIRYGDISRGLVDEEMSIDTETLEKKSTVAVKKHDVVIAECSELEKIEYNRNLYAEHILEAVINSTLQECDAFIGALLKNLDLSKDRIYVFSPVSSRAQDELTVFISAGKGIVPGYASSGITRRQGIVALGDIAPTILTFYHIKPPKQMVTTLIENNSSNDSLGQKQKTLVKMNNKALARDTAFNLIAAVFGLLAFSAILISLVAYKRKPGMRDLAKYLALMVLSLPAITFLVLPFMSLLSNNFVFIIALLLWAGLFGGIGFYFGESKGYIYVVLGFAILNAVTLVLDVLTGATLQLNSVFGYSAIVAGRYAGFGNMAFTILSISSLLVVACIKQIEKAHGKSIKNVNLYLLIFLVAILVLDGAPFFGSDVGGVLALTPTVFAVSMMLYDKKLGLKSVFISIFLTLGALALFSIVDLNRPVSERTHLGRFVETLFNGKAGIVIERKIAANLAILTNSTLSTVVIISTLVAIFLFLHPERYLKKAINEQPYFRFLVLPGIVLAVLALLLNDSGAAIPGMMAAIVLPATALIMFELEPVKKKMQSSTTSKGESV